MVFVQNSSEHTKKVVLNSDLRSTGSQKSHAKYNLITPVVTPPEQVSLASVESCMIKAPSLFSDHIILNTKNTFIIENVDKYRTDIAPVLSIFNNSDMTINDNIVTFFELFVLAVNNQGFMITIEGDISILNNAYMKDQYSIGINADGNLVYLYNTTTRTHEQFRAEILEKFKLMESIKFTIHNTSATPLIMDGPWLKIINLYNGGTEPITVDNNSTKECELQNEGYPYINIHTNFGRSVMTGSGDNNGIVPTDMLWSVPIMVPPRNVTFYTNNSTSGKIVYHFPVLDEILVYFTDQWNEVIYDIPNYVLVITFDFSEKEIFSKPMTLSDARNLL